MSCKRRQTSFHALRAIPFGNLVPMSVLLSFARHCAKMMFSLGLVAAAWAQPAPAPAPAAPNDGMQRSQRQADNVYRWIKMFAEPTRKADGTKSEPTKVRIPKEPAAPVVSSASTERTSPPPNPPASAIDVAAPAPSGATAASAASAATPTAAVAPTTGPAVAAANPASAASSTEEEDEDDELTILSQAQPEIPREIRNMLGTAKVAVAFTVQPDGSVQEASVISSTHRRLNRPTLDAVGQWKFAPVRTARAVRVELEFDLQ